jgi:heterodisulfide reductase subunit A-like polyferredoxin
VGAILLAPGFEPFDPRAVGIYGYGRMANVLTSMDYERLLSSTGPYEGEIRRTSDLKHPRKVAWIQCVGSRQVIPGGKELLLRRLLHLYPETGDPDQGPRPRGGMYDFPQ